MHHTAADAASCARRLGVQRGGWYEKTEEKTDELVENSASCGTVHQMIGVTGRKRRDVCLTQ
jgi:hypothetical protein